MMVAYNSLGMDYNDSTELPYQLLREYCESIASTYIKMVKAQPSGRAKTWIEKGFKSRASHVQALGEAIAASVSSDADVAINACNAKQLNKWLQSNTLLRKMTDAVFVHLYGVQGHDAHSHSHVHVAHPEPTLIPLPQGLEAMPDYPAFIDLSHIVWLNNHIPAKHQNRWRFLFSSHIHGESFSTMTGRIQSEGASLLIIEDNAGYIFGGYAPVSWTLGPNFVGNEDSFLFTLAPKMRVYPASNYNNHFQYMNHHTKTLPNGLLMGGQFNFGAIWVNGDPFGEGSSAESCSTYRGYKRLSKEPNFRIKSLEVWAVGEKPMFKKESVLGSSEKSCSTYRGYKRLSKEPNFRIKSLEVWAVGEKPMFKKESMRSMLSSRSSVLETRQSDRSFLALCGKNTKRSEGFRATEPPK
ncbi:hypothetical protein B5X24_HaOG214249 [Helicoverpa armigera]|uniref:MTOR-associated protein MEAK7 n=1 Tax=Helicoverpa armigera TaxID=29058 RepID=A0A2W1BCJ2_HELAM|nr:hypothetical protein B5X24_HaOG214249 [Helicoverpa armigera]